MASTRHRVDVSLDAKTGRAQKAFHDVRDSAKGAKEEVGGLDRFLLDIGGRKFTVSDIATGFNTMATAAKGALGIVMQVASAIEKMANRADEIGDVFGNLEIDIGPAREATRGLVNDLELARLANLATSTGVAKNAEEFGRLAEIADGAAVRLGKDTPDALKQLTEALAQNRKGALARMGVVVDQTTAERKYALQMGTTVDALSDAERAEAFRAAALDQLAMSTAHVERGTEGAAFAVKAASVDIQNLQDRMLGAAASSGNLRGAMIELAKRGMVPSVQAAKNQGETIWELRKALNEAGMSFSDTKLTIQEWVAEIEIANQAAQDFRDTVRDELLKSVDQLNKTMVRSFTGERVHQIEKEIISLNGLAGTEEHINDLLEEKARLLIHEAKIAGDTGRARALEREEELRLLKREIDLENNKNKTRAKGRKAQLEGLDLLLGAGADKAFDEFIKRLNESRKALDELFEEWEAERDVNNPFTPENLELQRRGVEERLALERAYAEQDLLERLRHLDELEAAGVDPISLINREEEARRDFLEGELERAEQMNDIIGAIRVRGEIEQNEHNARLARLHEERLAVEETRQKWENFAVAAGEAHLMFAQNVARAVTMQGQSLQEAVANVAKTQAIEFGLIQGPSELIRAAIAGASFNYPKMAQHLSNAGAAFAHGAAMGAIAGVAGGLGGGGAAGGMGRPQGALGAPVDAGGAAANDRGPGGVPLSLDEGTQRQIQDRDEVPENVIQIQPGAFQILGSIDESTADAIVTGIKRHDQSVGG